MYKEISKEEALKNPWDEGFLLKEKSTGNIYSLEIDYDPDALNPRDDDNICTIVSISGNHCIADDGYEKTRDELREWVEEKAKDPNYYFKPVYMYDHSGQTISLSDFCDKWDSGICGYIGVSKEKIFKEFKNSDTEATEDNWHALADKVMESEIKTYDTYICGDVFVYSLEKLEVVEHKRLSDGYTWTTEEWEPEDSCGGYYGDPEESGLIDDVVGNRFVFVKRVDEK